MVKNDKQTNRPENLFVYLHLLKDRLLAPRTNSIDGELNCIEKRKRVETSTTTYICTVLSFKTKDYVMKNGWVVFFVFDENL